MSEKRARRHGRERRRMAMRAPYRPGPSLVTIAVAGAAALLGFVTITLAADGLFGPPEARAAAAEATTRLMLWFEFGSGIAYVVAAGGLFLARPWGLQLTLLIAAATLAAAAALLAAPFRGGAFEPWAAASSAVRAAAWAAIAAHAWRTMGPRKSGGG